MSKNNNFSILLRLAAEECAEKEVKEFLSSDISEFPITPEIQKRANKIIRKSKKNHITPWRVIKYAAVACLLILSLCFTACMFVPEVREAIKEAFVIWYDEYIAVGFGDQTEQEDTEEYANMPLVKPSEEVTDISQSETSNDIDNSETLEVTGDQTEVMTEAPLLTIEEKAYATYLPEGYIETVKGNTSNFYLLSYSFEGSTMFSIRQSLIEKELTWSNSEGKTVTQEIVNGCEAIMTQDNTNTNKFTLVWQNEQYEFAISGTFENKEELFKIAEGIKTK